MVSPVIQGTIRFAGINVNPGKLLVLLGALVVMGALFWSLRTKILIAMMALRGDCEMACF